MKKISGRLKLENRFYPAFDSFKAVFDQAVQEAINFLFEDDTFIFFGNMDEDDADEISILDISLAMGTETQDDPVQFDFNLRELLRFEMASAADGECPRNFALMAKGLRKLADEIDAAIASSH